MTGGNCASYRRQPTRWVVADGPGSSEFRVRFVLEDTPAAKAGVQEGDVIVGAGGTPAATLRLVDLWRMLRQPDGTIVELDLRHGSTQRSVRLVPRSPV